MRQQDHIIIQKATIGKYFKKVEDFVSEPSRPLSLPPELRLIIYERPFSSFTTLAYQPSLLKISQLLRKEATKSYQKHFEAIWNGQHLRACWIMAKYSVLCPRVLCEAEMKTRVQAARSAVKKLCRELRLDGGELDPKALRLEINMNGLAIKILRSLPR